MANKHNKRKGKKRRFYGNLHHTLPVEPKGNETVPTPLKRLRINNESPSTSNDNFAHESYFLLFDFLTLKSMFEKYAKCKECDASLTLMKNEKKMGYSHQMDIQCIECTFRESHNTSPKISTVGPHL